MSDYDPAADTDLSASASNRVGRNAAGVLAKTAHLDDALAVGHEVGLARQVPRPKPRRLYHPFGRYGPTPRGCTIQKQLVKRDGVSTLLACPVASRRKEALLIRRTALLVVTVALTLLVAGGVALAVTSVGTDSPDTLMGTRGPDTLVGKGGTDWVDGRGGKDVISGGPGSDDPVASASVGILDGGPGADAISGGAGSDMMIDGPVRGDSAVDTLEGGKGNDNLLTFNRPAARDVISCGAGRDFADVDRKDVVGDDCERVSVHKG